MASSVDYLPLEKAKSPVWKYFGFPAREGKFLEPDKKKRQTVHCVLCKQSLSYKGNTTNLIVHLQYNHKVEYANISSKIATNSRMSEPSTPGQRSIAEAFENLTPLPRNSKRWQTLTASVCYFIGKDMQAYDCVNDPGFRNMLKSFEPRYIPPDRSTITKNTAHKDSPLE